MKRIAVVVVLAMMPLLMGAGGGNPPPFGMKIVGQPLTVHVVMDPHQSGVTTTAKQATVRIFKQSNHHKTAAALFTIPALFFLELGCDLDKTDDRFLQQPLSNWIPSTVLAPLFAELGISIGPTMDPVITQIVDDDCTPDPANPGPLSGGSAPGILSFQATIRFLAPK